MRSLVIVLALLGSVSAQAGSFYFINGKAVKTKGEATKAAMKDPKAKVVKVQASYVSLNDETMNLKKTEDISLDDMKKLF